MANKYEKTIDDIFSLVISEDNKATVTMDEVGPVTVQLANDDEARAMIEEFEDKDGEMMYSDESIFGKYPELHQFRP